MKSWLILIFLSVCLAGFLGCGSDEKDQDAAKRKPTTDLAVSEDVGLLHRAAEKEIAGFMGALKSELMSAIKEGGPAAAISVCHETAPEIAMQHSAQGWFISRVSDKSRNRNNQVDQIQRAILAQFINMESSPAYYDEWKTENGQERYYYYKPIYVTELCLNCHGPADKLAAGVSKKVAEMYPADEAIGYEIGDLRGMFVVEVDWPRGKEYALELVKDSL